MTSNDKMSKRLSSICSDVFPGESNNSIQNTFVSESHEMMFSQFSSVHTQNTSNLSNPQETSSFITFLDPITDISQLHASKRKKTKKNFSIMYCKFDLPSNSSDNNLNENLTKFNTKYLSIWNVINRLIPN
jgi:hypothetical protein